MNVPSSSQPASNGMVHLKKALWWVLAAATGLVLLIASLVTAFMLSIGGTFRGQGFTTDAAIQLLLLITICVGLGFILAAAVRAARRA